MRSARESKLSVAGSRAGLGRATEAFEAFSASHGVSDPVRRSIQVVLDELLSNTIRCGAGGGRDLTISLTFRLDADALRVEILDDGTPFDPLERASPDTTLPLEKRPVGGLGVMLVKNLVDEISWEDDAGRNRVRIRKRLDG
ncbi:MAG: ATP-binding protein [Thermoanaerobaculia bacterium]|nr:ATP-binding protein [Thermoanaerobaculia bacterium]